ncbi:MAG: phosphatase PAP2 family protein [Bacteroidota bacterium]|nr:phosphatase PAP2 family protein [Bacteroidota bacterium]
MNQILEEILILDKEVEKKFIEENVSIPAEIDLFFKWLPNMFVFITGNSSTKAKNKLIHNLLIISLADVISNSSVQFTKKLVDRRRPNSLFKYNSFPSSHTTTSFCGAELLRLKLKKKSLPLSLSGYALASIAASLRLYKRKHWFSDIVAGAVIGIVSARLSFTLYKKLILKA